MSGGDPGGAIRIDGGRQLLVDDLLIAQTNLLRSFHKPRTYSGSPVLVPETPGELNGGVNPCATMATVLFDPQDRLFKAWYMAGWDDGFGHAVSDDGVNWRRPVLDVVTGTNLFLPRLPGYIRHNASVVLDHQASDPSERFKMFAFYRAGTGSWPRQSPVPMPSPVEMAFIYTSPDGIHWTNRGRTGPCGDTTTLFRNPWRNTWVYSIRTFRGARGRGRSYWEHQDFLKSAQWEEGAPADWLGTDGLDRPDSALQLRPELYKMDAVAYESMMIGLFGIYYGPPNHVAWAEGVPKTVDLHLGFSRDGIDWQRPDRTAFLSASRKPGAWDYGYLQSSGAICLVVNDELRFYYGGFSGVSPKLGRATPAGGTLGMATLRRDGFASMDGPGECMPPVLASGHRDETATQGLPAGGFLTTKPVVFGGGHLFVNARIFREDLRVEVLREDYSPITGFSAGDCVPISGDSTRHPVHWASGANLASCAGQAVRLRFCMNSGELYSFWVARSADGKSGGYLAGGGPGFEGPRDV